MLTKLLIGEPTRKSRLHDEKGNFVDPGKLILHGPQALATGMLRLAFGYRPAMPWISYSAISILKSHLNKSSRVLEFGSGMSTIWYARHAGQVCSVEDYKPWFDKVEKLIASRNLKNIDYRFANSKDSYGRFKIGDNEGFDLVMVDGSHRSICVANAAKLLRPGGILYLDNSDKDSGPGGGDMRAAETLALNFARERNAQIEYFTDFAPTQLFVQQGLLIRLPNAQ